MKNIKKKYPFILLLILILIALTLIWYRYDGNWINLFLIVLFVLSVDKLYDFRLSMKLKDELSESKKIVETYDYVVLLNLLILTPHFIFGEISAVQNYSSFQLVSAVTLTLAITIIQFMTQFKSYHYIDEKGIHFLSGELMIEKDKIEEIEFHKREISIHTTKKRNDVTINKYRLASPEWGSLQTIVKQFLNPERQEEHE